VHARTSVLVAVLRDPNLRRVEVAFFGFNMTEYATWIAILVYAYARGGAPEAGFVALIQLIPAAIVAPFAAYASDRFRRDRVLFADYVAQAAALAVVALALLADAPVGLVYPLAAVAAASLTFTRPAHNALLPAITRTPEALTAANVATSVAEGAGVMAGPLIGGVLLGLSGPGTVFAAFAGVTLVGALLVGRVRADADAVAPAAHGPGVAAVWAETVAGFSTLARAREPRLLVGLLSAEDVVLGALDVLFVASAIDLLHTGESGAGYLNAAFGAGGLIGAAAAVTLVGRRRLTPPLAAGALGLAVPVAAVALSPSAATAPLFFAASGSGRTVADVAGRTLLQRVSPDEVLARVFGILEGLSAVAVAVGSITASALVEAVGIRGALAITGAFVPAVLILVGPRLLAIDRHAVAPDAAVLDLLRRTPIFAPLPAPAIERLAPHLVRVEVPTGTVVIREGEPGDRFYVIARGEVDVASGGRSLGRRGVGDYVGEIALLRDVPRTATVTARTPVVLYALERGPFLAAVTGHPASRDEAERRIDRDLAATRGERP
jgi:MFS family permease